jgi:hypothetical protein
MLVQLGDFTVAQAGPDEEHSYLPDKAMGLIAEYQRSPQIGPLSESADERGDSTSASYTELPASYRPASRRKPGHGRTGASPGAGAGAGAAGGPGWRRWLRAHLAWAGWAGVGAALVVVGVVLGSSLSGSSSQNPLPVPPRAPKTVCGSSGQAGSEPGACMVRQSLGSAGAAWVVRASGFEPGQPVTVSLSFTSPPIGPPQKFTRTVRVTPSAGTFQLNIDQLFPDAVQLGIFDVKVSGPGGREAKTEFIVIPAGGP